MNASRILSLVLAGLLTTTATAQRNDTSIVLADVTITASKPENTQIALHGYEYDLVWETAGSEGIRLSVFPVGKPRTEKHRLVSYACMGSAENHNIVTYWNQRVLGDQHLVDVASLAWRQFLAVGQQAQLAGR